MLEEYKIDCPYCGEQFVMLVDMSTGQQTYVEDCQICCQPIVFQLSLDTISSHITLTTRREND